VFPHGQSVRSATFSADGEWILTACEDGMARLFRLDAPRPEAVQVFADHNAKLFSAEFSPDGQLILTTSRDGTVRLWNRAGRRVARLAAEEQAIWSAQFSPQRDWVAVSPSDGIVRLLWENSEDLYRTVVGRSLLPEEQRRLDEIKAEILGGR
jgi:YD repeat-containing protein